MLMVTAGAIAIVGSGAAVAVLWWRSYFRRLFEARFQPQDDGSYVIYWARRRGQPIEVYRIDAVTKERVVGHLTRGSVASTGLFVGLVIAAVLVNILWPTPLMIPGMFLLGVLVFLPQRRASRQAGRLIITGIRLDHTQCMRSPEPTPEVTARSLRLIILVSCLIAVVGAAVVLIFVLDPDTGAIAWTDRSSLSFVLLLVVLPLSVALFNWWALRRTRS
jgi:hypothetical protein